MRAAFMQGVNRRQFLMGSALVTGAAACSSSKAMAPPPPYVLPAGARIVFQGDSITDADHWPGTLDPNHAAGLGYGYPLFIAQHLLLTRPNHKLQLFNRARGGDTVPLLQERWKTSVIDIHPHLLSIMIGLNDFVADSGTPDYALRYEQRYRALIDTTRSALPQTQLVIVEPYLVDTEPVPEFDSMREAALRVARYAEAIYVPTHDLLNRLIRENGHQYWFDDQHPTVAGSAAIASQWLKAVGS